MTLPKLFILIIPENSVVSKFCFLLLKCCLTVKKHAGSLCLHIWWDPVLLTPCKPQKGLTWAIFFLQVCFIWKICYKFSQHNNLMKLSNKVNVLTHLIFISNNTASYTQQHSSNRTAIPTLVVSYLQKSQSSVSSHRNLSYIYRWSWLEDSVNI